MTLSFFSRRLIRLGAAAGPLFLFLAGPGTLAQERTRQVEITLDGSAPRVDISPTLYGIFLEEINHAGEGGIYAEMVQNRDFETNTLPAGASWAGNLLKTAGGWQERKGFGNSLSPWRLEEKQGAAGQIRQVDEHPLNAENPHSLLLDARSIGAGLGVINDGFWGMHFEAGEEYDLRFYARTAGDTRVTIAAELQSASGREIYAKSSLTVSGDWKQYQVALRPSQSDSRGRLSLGIRQPGKVWFDVVSLFPRRTFRGRVNGFRPDLAATLEALHPAFVRFPGGAVSGGLNLDDRFQWKHSIGDVAKRQGMFDLWGYYSTSGLGFHEYLQLIEDLGASALYVCNPGFSDNYRHAEYAKPEEVPNFVQEALDALEYALGPADSRWGAQRAANGHPAPFPLRYVEIGNETSGTVYATNFALFYTALKARYPQLTIIAAANVPGTDMVDRHFFGKSIEDMYSRWSLFDSLPRTGPTYYVGEYALTYGVGEGDLSAALAEAAFMMGLERNSDVVRMSSYAPLLANVNDQAWPVNMIRFDSSRVAPRSSYYVQKLFAQNRPDQTLRTTMDPAPGKGAGDVYALGGWDASRHQVVLKVVNRAQEETRVKLSLLNLPALSGNAIQTILSNPDPRAENTVDDPTVVVPAESRLRVQGNTPTLTLKGNSLSVFRFETVPAAH